MRRSPDELLAAIASGEGPEQLLARLLDDDATRLAALPRRLDEQVLAVLLGPAGDPAQELARLARRGLTERVPGSSGMVRLRRDVREQQLQRLWQEGKATTAVPAELAALSARLADHFDARKGLELEALYHRLAVDPDRAARGFEEHFNAAEAAFDLTRCHDVLAALTETGEQVPHDVSALVRRLSARLAARTRWIDDWHRSARFLAPAGSADVLDRLVRGDVRTLELLARGGMGKTTHLRWLVARRCVPEQVACARIDFDEADPAAAMQSPWLVLLGIAEQLAPQIPSGAFDAIVRQFGDQLPRLYPGTGVDAPLPLSLDQDRDIGGRVVEAFHSCIASLPPDQRWLVILDTLEVPLLLLPEDRSEPLGFLDELARLQHHPAGRLVFAGRNALGHAALFPDAEVHRLTGFGLDERRRYLREKRGVQDPKLVEAAATVAGKVPLKLALVADVIDRKRQITADELVAYGEPSLLYLVERVLDRVDERTRWALRYGAVPRALDLAFIRDVARPYLRRGMSGDASVDRVTAEKLPDDRAAGELFHGDLVRPGEEVDVDALWAALRRYAGDSSWVWIPQGRADALRLHGDVIQPMRAWLAKQDELYDQLQRDAARYFEEREAADPEHAADHAREAVFHHFQYEGPEAVVYWRARLRDAAGPGEAQLRLALAEDVARAGDYFGEDGPVTWRDGRPLVDEATRAEARFEAAWAHIQIARTQRLPPTSRHWRDACDLLRAAEGRFADPRGRRVTEARVGMARAALSVAQGDAAAATQHFKQARKGWRATDDLLWAWLEYGPQLAGGALRGLLRDTPAVARLLARGTGRARYWRRRFEEVAATRDEDQDRLDRALGHLEQWAALADPNEEQSARAAIAKLRLRTGENGAALRLIGDPATPRARLTRAWALVRRLEARKALDDLDRVAADLASGPALGTLDLRALEAEAAELRGRACAALLDVDGARHAFVEAADLWSAAGNLEGTARAHVRRASFLLHLIGDVRGATLALAAAEKAGAPEAGAAWTKTRLLRAHVAARSRDQAAADAAVQEALDVLLKADAPPRRLVAAALTALAVSAPAARPRYARLLVEQLNRVRPEGALLALVARLRRVETLDGVGRPTLGRLRRLVPSARDSAFRDLDNRDRAMLLLADAEIDRLAGERAVGLGKLREARADLAADPGGAALGAWLGAIGRLGGDPELVAPVRPEVERWLDDPRTTDGLRGGLAVALGRAWGIPLEPGLERRLEGMRREVATTRGSGPWEAGIVALLADSARARGDDAAAEDHGRHAARIFHQLGDAAACERVSGGSLDTGELRPPPPDSAIDVTVRLRGAAFRIEVRDGPADTRADAMADRDLAAVVGMSRGRNWSEAYAQALVRRLVERPGQLAEALLGVLLRGDLVTALVGKEARDVRLRLATPSLEAMPWELAGTNAGTDLAGHRGVRHLYRGPAAPTVDVVEVRSLQHALGFTGTSVPVDGRLGPETHAALADFQRGAALEPTGNPDPVTVQRLQALLCPHRSVTILRPAPSRALMKGAWRVTPVERLYAGLGFTVQTLESPALDEAIEALSRRPTAIIHISAPLIETGGSVTLDVGSESVLAPAARGHQTEWLSADALDQAFNGPLPAPIVVLDPPQAASEVDTATQLVLRNAFVGELFALGNTRALFGTGLAEPHDEDRQTTALLEHLASGASLGKTIAAVRRSAPSAAAATLHARSADLLPPWW